MKRTPHTRPPRTQGVPSLAVPPARRFGRLATQSAGFTLLEIVLVLAILVAMAAMVWPSLFEPLADQRLRSAAEQIRAAWQTARTDAMTSGQIYMFRFHPESNTYQLSLWEGAVSSTDAPAGNLAESSVSQRPLPEGIRFTSASQADDPRADQLAARLGQSGSGTSSIPPVMFYPNGETSTAQLWLANEENRCIAVELRGLTGVTSVSAIHAREELP